MSPASSRGLATKMVNPISAARIKKRQDGVRSSSEGELSVLLLLDMPALRAPCTLHSGTSKAMEYCIADALKS